jgi:hypothetical protein
MAYTTLSFHKNGYRIPLTLLLACLLAFGSYTVQALDLEWATRAIAGARFDGSQGNGIAADSDGNTYVVGDFNGSMTFGPGEAREVTLVSVNNDGFLAKYAVNGDLVWVKHVGSRMSLNDLAIDDSGNIYVMGSFFSDFLAPLDLEDIFTVDAGAALLVRKYTANGDLVWTKSVVGNDSEVIGSELDIDGSGNVYVVGDVPLDIISLNSGAIFGLGEAGEIKISTAFIAKFNNVDGSLIWAHGMDLFSSYIRGIAVDDSGDFYITGGLGEEGFISTFLQKYTADGDLVWAQRNLSQIERRASDIALDSSGNPYIVGTFRKGTITFSPFESDEANLINNDDSPDIYAVKYTPDGKLVWVEHIIGENNANNDGHVAPHIAVDDNGTTYITDGTFGTLTFGPGEPGAITLTSDGSSRTFKASGLFVAKYTADGNLISVHHDGGNSDVGGVRVGDIAVNDSGNVSITGSFFHSATFGTGGDLETTFISEDEDRSNIFVAKYNSDPVPPSTSDITPVVVEARIAASADDAEEIITSGTVNTGSRDLEMAEKNNKGRLVGMRFNSLNIPKDATITDAYLQFQVNDLNSERADLTIRGQATVNAPTFAAAKANISSRIQTDAFVEWTPEPWNTPGEAESDQKTPNIASVIQEIVKQEGWLSGSSLAIIVSGTGMRSAESFDGDSAAAPSLHVEYTIGAGTNQLLAVEAGPDQKIAFSDDDNRVDVNLDGNITINNNPPNQPTVTTTWSKQSGPGTVTFENPNAVDTTVSFSAVGIYKLRLTADNGIFTDFDAITVTVNPAQALIFQWAKHIVNHVEPPYHWSDIAVDGSGNTYITGVFEGSTTFGSGETLETTLTSDGDSDIFIAKYTADGDLIWARRAGGVQGDEGRSIAVDSSGNVYITGIIFRVSATFGPGEAGETTLTSHGKSDIFVAKYTSDGDLIWARNDGGTAFDVATGIAVDDSGNIYITGNFSGLVTFGAGEAAETMFQNVASNEVFVAKYTTDGDLIWAKQAAGNQRESGRDIAVDDSGNVYVTGDFEGTLTFRLGENREVTIKSDDGDKSGGIFGGGRDIFVAKYTTDGNLVWVNRAGGVSDDAGASLAVDGSGNVFVTGYFRVVATFGFGESGETSLIDPYQVGNIFVAKYFTSGKLAWAKHVRGSGYSTGEGIAVDDSGNVYVTGNTRGPTTFGSGEAGEITLPSDTNSTDLSGHFLAKYTSKGNLISAKYIEGRLNSSFETMAIALDGRGNAYITGNFVMNVIFEPNEADETTFISDGYSNMFIAKYTNNPISVNAAAIEKSRIAASSDDAEENTATGEVKPGSSDLELGHQNQKNQLVGMRFNGLNIPQGATITNASIQFQTDETHSGVSSLMIEGEAVDNALTFTNANANISSRALTDATIDWVPAPWTTEGEAGIAQQSPNIASIIQEIVERPGWSIGNSLVVIISGSGRRNAESFNGDSAGAPVLHVEYQ